MVYVLAAIGLVLLSPVLAIGAVMLCVGYGVLLLGSLLAAAVAAVALVLYLLVEGAAWVWRAGALRYRAWRHRRRWPAAYQLDRLRMVVMADNRWLAHDPVASAITDRYLALLGDDWMRQAVMDQSDFRRSIGLDPHQPRNRP